MLGLASTGLIYPNYEWLQPVQEMLDEAQQQEQMLLADEMARNFQAEQKEIIINDYFTFAEKIGKIFYARGCAGGYEKPSRSDEKQRRIKCSPKSFDCGGAMKAYLVAKWITDSSGIAWLNSSKLYELGLPKDPRSAERGDFMYRRGYNDVASGNMSTHFSVVSRDYTGWSSMWIFDNVVPWWVDRYNEREIKVACNEHLCRHLGKYRIYISNNWAVEMASTNAAVVVPWIDTDVDTWEQLMSMVDLANPLGFSVTISGFAYDSDANRIASYRYDKNQDLDMIATFIVESHFDTNAIGPVWEKWLCQLLPAYNKQRVNNPQRSSGWQYQAEICRRKREAVPKKSIIWMWYNVRGLEKKNIVLQ